MVIDDLGSLRSARRRAGCGHHKEEAGLDLGSVSARRISRSQLTTLSLHVGVLFVMHSMSYVRVRWSGNSPAGVYEWILRRVLSRVVKLCTLPLVGRPTVI